MSRTHAHRPVHARPGVHRESHDHRDGPCDLLALADWLAALRTTTWFTLWQAHRCHWHPDWTTPLCGCNLCTAHDARIRTNRTERRKVAELLRSWTPQTAAEVDDAVSHLPGRPPLDW